MKYLTLAALLMAASPALAHDFKAGDLTIGHPMAYATTPVARTAAGYLTVTNTGDSPDALVGIRAEFPKVTMHETVHEGDVAKMIPVDRLEIAPGETLTFAPGGNHVMFMGLTAPFKAGDHVPATLVFEKAGEVEVQFNVEDRGEAGATMEMDHEGMEGMDHE